MLVFASDYPHPEGTSDPIKKFEAKMENCDESTMEAFYHGNMEELMGISLSEWNDIKKIVAYFINLST